MKSKFRAFQIFFVITISSIISLAQNQPIIARLPKIIFKSSDKNNPDIFKKISLTNSQNSLYILSNKGYYHSYFSDILTILEVNRLYASHGYIDYSNLTYSKSISQTPYISTEVVSDSCYSMALSYGEIPFFLTNLELSYAKTPTINNWYITTIAKRILLTEQWPRKLINGQWPQKRDPITGLLSYISKPTIFDFNSFAIYDVNRNQQNDFSAMNIISGKDNFYYLTAINDQFKNFSSSLRLGGSTINGTITSPNIYKFNYDSKIDGSSLGSSSLSPSFLNVGQGKLVHVDEFGNLYIIQSDRIIKQAPNSTQTEIVAGGNDAGPAINQLILNVESQQPVAFDSNQNMYICDYTNERIVYWAKGSKQGKVLISREINKLESFKPISITLDANNNIYVADNYSHSILKYENCNYLTKPVTQQISNEDITTSIEKPTNWYFNNLLINNENQKSLKPKSSGYYQSQTIDNNGCLSPRSDSLQFVCKPIKPEVSKTSKFELSSNTPIDPKTYADFEFAISNYGTVNLINKSKNVSSYTWSFPDGSVSNEFNTSKTFTSSGSYLIKLTVGNSKNEISKIEKQIVINIPSNPLSNLIANIPVQGYNNIWEDISGFQNHASFNGKINQLTNKGIFTYVGTSGTPKHIFASIKLAGCSIENMNERIIIPNPVELKMTKAITLSAWFGLDPTISMNPANGLCGSNGRQVLFSKGGDGFGSSLPGFNALIDINNNNKTLMLEFSKNSGNFSMNIPLNGLLDSIPQVETFEEYYYRNGDDYDSDYRSLYPKILMKYREGNLEFPFQHFVISFDENKVLVYLNGRKIAEETHKIPLTEINQQDLYIGALGPKSIPYNGIVNWYPFKGRIDRIKVFNKLITDQEVTQLYLEKNSHD